MNTSEALRYGRQVALAELGPQGQARLLRAMVAFVVGPEPEVALKTAALYLGCAGVQRFRVLLCEGVAPPPWVVALKERFADARIEMVDVSTLPGAFDGCDVALCSRANDAFVAACERRGIPGVVANAHDDGLNVMSLRPSLSAAAGDLSAGPFESIQASTGTAAPSVLAGTLAACEALWLLAGRRSADQDQLAPEAGIIRHMHVPFLTPNAPPNTHNIPWPSSRAPQQP